MYCYNCMNQSLNGQVCDKCHKKLGQNIQPHHLRPGQLLNKKYLVGNCIGEGGFGITYIGRDTVLDIKVAIKEFFPNGYVNRNNAATQQVTIAQAHRDFFSKGKMRFLEEAKNIAKFTGEPGIVEVREYFEENGTAYIIMEYLDGVNLSKYIKQNGIMAPKKVFDLMLPVMQSLQKVHDAGIIHRDISPDNIMYLKNGTLKLMDFGSARHFTNEEKEMSVMLKQGYAPEEQYRKNGNQGPWTDVYSLCATMYRCITGIVPDNALDRLHSDNLVPPSQRGIAISSSLEKILMCGLAVHKESRYQNMRMLRENVYRAYSMKSVQGVAGAFANNNANVTLDANEVYNNGYRQNNQYNDNKKSNSTTVAIIVLIVSIVVLLAGAFFYFVFPMLSSSDEQTPTQSTTSVETQPPTEPTKPTEEETKDEKIEIPDVKGKKLNDAIKALEKKDLIVTDPVYVNTTEVKKDCVVNQYPSAGEKVEKGTIITLYVAKPVPTEKPTQAPTDAPTEADTDIIPQSPTMELEESEQVQQEVDYIESEKEHPSNKSEIVEVGANENGIPFEREYLFLDGELVLAVVKNDYYEVKLYFKDEELIRYVDEYGYIYDEFLFLFDKLTEFVQTESSTFI